MQKNLIRKILIALVALLPLPASAQVDEDIELPRWYQIELLIFAQNRVDTEEVFRDQPFELEENSILSNAPRINTLLNMHADGSLLPTKTDTNNDSAELENANTIPEINTDTAFEAEATETLPTPEFIAALESELLLNEHHEKLRRRSAYRVLWHGAWQQALEENSPVNTYSLSAGRLLIQPREEAEETAAETTTPDSLDNLFNQLQETPASANDIADNTLVSPEGLTNADKLAEAKAIIAASPASFRELQGSFKIYKTRFAHLDLDLWFTQMDDTTPGLNLPQLVIHDAPVEDMPVAQENETDSEEIPTVSAQDFLHSEDDLAVLTEVPEPLSPSFEMRYELAYEPNLYGHIKEDRRVRPEELYYVDHPLFGAVIKMVEVPHPLLRSNDKAPIDPLAF